MRRCKHIIYIIILKLNKTMKELIVLSIISLFSLQIFAQEISMPENLAFKTKEDYQKYEKEVLTGIDWLMKQPIDEQVQKRKTINAFVLAWLTGSPSVSISISQDIVTFIGCSECLLIYMGGYTKYVLENKDDDLLKANVAAIKSVTVFYKKNKETLGKIKALEKYGKLIKQGKLESHLTEKI